MEGSAIITAIPQAQLRPATLPELHRFMEQLEIQWIAIEHRIVALTRDWPEEREARWKLEEEDAEFKRLNAEQEALMAEKQRLYDVALAMPARSIEDIAALVDMVIDGPDVTPRPHSGDRQLLEHLIGQLAALAPQVNQNALYRLSQWTECEAPAEALRLAPERAAGGFV